MENDKSIKSVLINEHAFKLYQSKKITIQEALMLSIIASLDNEHGCFATNRYFADNLPIEVERVKDIIKALVKKGYVKSKIVNNNKRILRVAGVEKVQEQEQAPAKADEVPAQEPAKPAKEKKIVKFDNTYKPKRNKFCNIVNHSFDYDELQAMEQHYVEDQLNKMGTHEMSDRAKELLAKVNIDEEPSEWQGVNQLKI